MDIDCIEQDKTDDSDDPVTQKQWTEMAASVAAIATAVKNSSNSNQQISKSQNIITIGIAIKTHQIIRQLTQHILLTVVPIHIVIITDMKIRDKTLLDIIQL